MSFLDALWIRARSGLPTAVRNRVCMLCIGRKGVGTLRILCYVVLETMKWSCRQP